MSAKKKSKAVATATLGLALLAGCGGPTAPNTPATPERLREGQRVALVAREGRVDEWTGARERDGKLEAIVSGGGIASIPSGMPATVVSDEHPELGWNRTIKVVMEQGEFAGRECRLARFFLEETGGAR